MVKIRKVEFEPCLHVSPLQGFSTKNSEEKTLGENDESSHSNNARSTSLSSSVDKQTLHGENSLGTWAPSDPNNAKSTSLSGSPEKEVPRVELSLGTEATSCSNNAASISNSMDKENPDVDISVGSQVMSDSNNAHSTTLSGLVNKQTHVDLSLGTRASSEKDNQNSPSDNCEPHSRSRDVQTSHSERPFRSQDSSEQNCENSHSNNGLLKLVSCSVMFFPVCGSEDHITDNNLRSSELVTPLLGSASVMSNENIPQLPPNYGGANGWIGKLPPSRSTSGKLKRKQNKYRGVTRHRWTGKYEAHLWDKNSGTEGHTNKGKQVYLGGYETEEKAAQAYDLAVLKYWGPSASTKLNFPIESYTKEIEEMENTSREEFVMSLRRKSSCFARGSSIYRGVTRYREGQWQARIKKSPGEKDTYLGTFRSEEEAARAYDIAAFKLRGTKALTNFDSSTYIKEDGKELEEPLQPKRRRRRADFAPVTTLVVTSDSRRDESIMIPTVEPLLPDPPCF